MDNAQLWQRYHDWLYYDPDLNFYLDISRMRFLDELVQQMQPKFEKAFQDIADLEAGTIANPDEDRMVGHYWLRHPDLAPSAELKAEITNTLERIKTFAAQVHSGEIHPPRETRFTDVISIGIGGSALGPQFVSQALVPLNAPINLHFIDNTDPAGMDRLLEQLRDRLSTTLVLVISKLINYLNQKSEVSKY